ncbi:MAG: CaiB/BaiF CoA-transferase family protein [Acidimicrobiales bacterium]
MLPSPLEGIRVLDLSRVVSGPFAGRMLSDLGADVVKVEPPDGDITRIWGEKRHGLSGFYTQQNAGKRNVCVDLRAAGGPDVVLALAAAADVMIENFRPGILDRFGLGWPRLNEVNPGLILLSISGFGQTGPETRRQAYASVLHAESGLIARQAEFDRAQPTDPILSIADYDAGLHGLVGILAALHLRHRTGTGQHVDISMLDSMLATDDYAHHALDGSPTVRLGGDVWDAPGGPILVSGALQNTWRTIHTRYHVPDPTPPGADLETKVSLRRHAVATWFRSFGDRAELVAALEAGNLAWADVRAAEDAFAQPTAVAHGAAATVDDRGGGTRRVVQSPYRFSAAASGVRGGAPRRGEHNAAVLGDWLGWDAAKVRALEEAAVLQAEPPEAGT